jgi:hypothetical protein
MPFMRRNKAIAYCVLWIAHYPLRAIDCALPGYGIHLAVLTRIRLTALKLTHFLLIILELVAKGL